MKKILVILMSAVMFVCLCACSSKVADPNPDVQKLLDDGYTISASTWDESSVKAVFKSESDVKAVIAAITEKQYKQYDKIAMDTSKTTEDQENFFLGLEVVKIIDLSGYLPSDSVVQAFVGKTVGWFAENGFTEMASTTTEEDISYSFDNGKYSVHVVADLSDIKDVNDLSPNDIKKLVIKEVELEGISANILDIL